MRIKVELPTYRGRYIAHSIDLANIATRVTGDKDIMAAASLNGAVEDMNADIANIVSGFCEGVGRLYLNPPT